jgi:hypothetical protein
VIFLRLVVAKEYANLAIPADRIVADPQLAAQFYGALNRHLLAELPIAQGRLKRRGS